MRYAFLAGLGFAAWKAEDVVRALKELGYEGVEWTLAHINPRHKSTAENKSVVTITEDLGLEVSELVVQQNYVWLDGERRKEAIALTKESIELCAAIGVLTINLFTGPPPWDPGAPKVGRDLQEGAAWDMVFAAFDELIPLAEKNRVNLAVEGVWGMLAHDFYTTRFLIDHYDSEFLGVNLDPSHGILVGNMDVGWIVRQWGEKVKHVHLKDCVGVPDSFLFPMLGEGKVNWSDFFKALDEIGFSGFCSVEFESFDYYAKVLKNDPVAAARVSMEQIRALTEGIT